MNADQLLKASSADLNDKQDILFFHKDELANKYSLTPGGNIVRSFEGGSNIMITPSSTSLEIDVTPSVTVEFLRVEQNAVDNSQVIIKNNMTGNAWASLYLESNGCVGHLISGINGTGTAEELGIFTNTNHEIVLSTNRFANSTPNIRLKTNHDTVFYGEVDVDSGVLNVTRGDTNHTTATTGNKASVGYSSLYLSSSLNNNVYTDQAQLWSGFGSLNVTTNNLSAINFVANRFSASTNAMSVNTDNTVTVHTTFYNNSDSKLKDNQQTADHAVIQKVFDSIDVKTYERNDLNNEKRIGFIADDFFEALPQEFSKIVSEHTYQKAVEDGEPIPPPETIKQLDYSRLVCILWGALKNTNKRLSELENSMNQTAKHKTRS